MAAPTAGGEGLGRAGFGILVLRGVGLAGLFLLQFVLARGLGPDGYGVYAYAYSLLMLLLIPTKLGLDIAGVRFVAAALAEGDRRTAARFVLFALARTTAAGLVLAVLWYVVGRALGADVLGQDPSALLWAAVTLPALGIIRTAEGALRGARRYFLAFVPFAVVWPFLITAAVVVADVAVDVDATQVLAVQAVASWLMAVVTAVFATRALVAGVDRGEAVSPGLRRSWLRTAARLTVFTGLTLVLGESDVVLVGLLLGEGDAGRYALAWRISVMVAGFLVAFNYAFGPVAARLHHQGDHAGLQDQLDRTMALIAPLSIVAAVGLIAVSPLVEPVFGADYAGTGPLLAVLAVSQMCNALGGPVALLLNMSGNERPALLVLGSAAVFNVVLNIVLLQTVGLIGAAVGTLISTVLWNGSLAVVVHRRLGLVVLRPRHMAAALRQQVGRLRRGRLTP